MPTTPLVTYGTQTILVPLKNPEAASTEVLNLKASTTFLAGTLIGEITASPGTYGPYASGNVDGTQLPTHILEYACITDAAGNVSFGSGFPAGATEFSQTSKGAPAFRDGLFNCADLVGLDANCINPLRRAILEQGTVASGRVMWLGV